MRNFKELKIWQRGVKIANDCFLLVEKFPPAEKFALSRQITKAAVSIPSNIAEGNSRKSNKDKRHFIEIALGSSFELETQVLIAQNAGFGDPAIRITVLEDLDEEQKMIMAFIDTLGD